MAYATITQLKQEVGIEATDTSQDAYLTDLLDWISSWINDYCKRQWSATPITVTGEVHDMVDDNKIWLANADVTSVDAVKLGQSSSGTTVTLDSTAYQWNKLGRLIIFSYPSAFPNEPRTMNRDYYLDYVTVDYKFAAAVPKAIEGACVEAAAKVYRNNNVVDEEIGDWKVRYSRNGVQDVFNDMGVLDAYRLRGV